MRTRMSAFVPRIMEDHGILTASGLRVPLRVEFSDAVWAQWMGFIRALTRFQTSVLFQIHHGRCSVSQITLEGNRDCPIYIPGGV